MTFLHRKFCTVSVHNEWSEWAVLTWKRKKIIFFFLLKGTVQKCVPQVVETRGAQKHILCIYYKVNTYYKCKTKKKNLQAKTDTLSYKIPPPNTPLPLHLKVKTYLKASEIFHLQRLLFFGVPYDAIFKKVPWIRPTQIWDDPVMYFKRVTLDVMIRAKPNTNYVSLVEERLQMWLRGSKFLRTNSL